MLEVNYQHRSCYVMGVYITSLGFSPSSTYGQRSQHSFGLWALLKYRADLPPSPDPNIVIIACNGPGRAALPHAWDAEIRDWTELGSSLSRATNSQYCGKLSHCGTD